MTSVEKETTSTISFRIPADEKEMFRVLAETKSMQVSDYIREVLRDHLAAVGDTEEPNPVKKPPIVISEPEIVCRSIDRLEEIVQDLYDVLPHITIHDTTDRIDNNAAFTKIATEEILRIKHPVSSERVQREFERRGKQ